MSEAALQRLGRRSQAESVKAAFGEQAGFGAIHCVFVPSTENQASTYPIGSPFGGLPVSLASLRSVSINRGRSSLSSLRSASQRFARPLRSASLRLAQQSVFSYLTLAFAVSHRQCFPATSSSSIPSRNWFASAPAQLGLDPGLIELYKRQPTILRASTNYHSLSEAHPFDDAAPARLEQFLFEEACRLEQSVALMGRSGSGHASIS